MKALRFLAAFLLAAPALADHPEARLDDAIAEKEPAFEPTDLHRLPEAGLRGRLGEAFHLGDLADRIVVLSFAPEDCGAPCSAQQARLAEAAEAVNVTPMRDLVTFVTVSSTRAGAAYPPAGDVRIVAPASGETVAALARRFSSLSRRGDSAPQAHVIDRRGRHAGIFHGADFGSVNMVLFLNGLTNAPPAAPGLWDRVMEVFR